MIRHQIETFWKDLHLQQGYQLVYSPHVAKIDLWKTSGHFDFYKESMFDQMQVCGAGEGQLPRQGDAVCFQMILAEDTHMPS